jgi:hypothetical protein
LAASTVTGNASCEPPGDPVVAGRGSPAHETSSTSATSVATAERRGMDASFLAERAAVGAVRATPVARTAHPSPRQVS